MRMSVLALLLSLVLPGLAPAQSRPFERQLRAAAALQASVRLPASEAQTALGNELVSPRRFSSRAPGATLMIIGGVAFLAGLFVEGTGARCSSWEASDWGPTASIYLPGRRCQRWSRWYPW